jgi:hypothetical protein
VDADRFDALTRALTALRSRRGTLTSLLGGMLGLLGRAETAAKKTRRTPNPPAATCTDGVKNGSETDVDCGGRCARCGLGQRCARGADCETASCHAGVCGTCGAPFDPCGPAPDGASCFCYPPDGLTTSTHFCLRAPAESSTTSCVPNACPHGTFCAQTGFDTHTCHSLCQ